ncbi:hypothetical protein [Rhizobium leguminosarum]|nr:hypothetical protein [Rhizobium leguminosarum]
MSIEYLQTYLVYPNKGVAEPRLISGTDVPLEGEVFTLLNDVYLKSERECSIDIAFNQPADGVVSNPCRALFARLRAGAFRRHWASSSHPPCGSFYAAVGAWSSLLATGMVGAQRKIVIARFAANSGILADENREALSVQFVERVFLKSVGSYKAVLYQDLVTEHGFWIAKAVDRQINSSETEVSRYWITDFLDSDFKTTSATGTRVLAVAMRNAAKATENLDIKKEITAAATLGAGLNNQVMTANDFIARLGLSHRSREAITGQMRHQGLLNEQFRFSAEEFNRQLPYKSVELHNGAILTAAATEFDQVFARSEPTAEGGQVTYEATGRVISEKLEKVPR